MGTKIVIAATFAALGLSATHAEAGEGNGDPFPFKAPPIAVSSAYLPWAPDTGSVQYPAINPSLSTPSLAQATLPQNGQNSAVETANSLPVDAMLGTPAYAQAQITKRWLAQDDHRPLQPNLATARANTPLMGQARVAERPAEVELHQSFDGNPPDHRRIVQARARKYRTNFAHQRIFATPSRINTMPRRCPRIIRTKTHTNPLGRRSISSGIQRRYVQTCRIAIKTHPDMRRRPHGGGMRPPDRQHCGKKPDVLWRSP